MTFVSELLGWESDPPGSEETDPPGPEEPEPTDALGWLDPSEVPLLEPEPEVPGCWPDPPLAPFDAPVDAVEDATVEQPTAVSANSATAPASHNRKWAVVI